MNRQPQYNKAQSYRIVSLPGQLWQLQRHSGQFATKTVDPWVKASHPQELADAQASLRKTDAFA